MKNNWIFLLSVLVVICSSFAKEVWNVQAKCCQVYLPGDPNWSYLPTVISIWNLIDTSAFDLHLKDISNSLLVCIRLVPEKKRVTIIAKEKECGSNGFNITHWPREDFHHLTHLYITKKEEVVEIRLLNSLCRSFTFNLLDNNNLFISIGPLTTAMFMFNCHENCKVNFHNIDMYKPINTEKTLTFSVYNFQEIGNFRFSVYGSDCYHKERQVIYQSPKTIANSWNNVVVNIIKRRFQVKVNGRKIGSHNLDNECGQIRGMNIIINGTELWTEGCQHQDTTRKLTIKERPTDSSLTVNINIAFFVIQGITFIVMVAVITSVCVKYKLYHNVLSYLNAGSALTERNGSTNRSINTDHNSPLYRVVYQNYIRHSSDEEDQLSEHIYEEIDSNYLLDQRNLVLSREQEPLHNTRRDSKTSYDSINSLYSSLDKSSYI